MNYARPPRPDRFGRHRPEAIEYRSRRNETRERQPANGGRRLIAVAMTLVAFAFCGVFGLATVTGPAAAERILARSVPALTQVDVLVALHDADMRKQAQSSPAQPLVLPDFPIRVGLSPRVVLQRSPASLQTLIDQRAAQAMYQQGAGAFVAPGARSSNRTGSLLSPAWVIHEAFNVFNPQQHVRLMMLSGALALLAAVLALLYGRAIEGPGWLVGVGAAAMIGAIAAGIVSGLAWFVIEFYTSGADSSLAVVAWRMFADAAWTMVLIDVVAVATAGGLLAAGLLLGKREQRSFEGYSEPVPAGGRSPVYGSEPFRRSRSRW